MSSPFLKTARLSATVLALAGVLNLPGPGAAAPAPAPSNAPRAAVSPTTPATPTPTAAQAAEAYGKLPLRFEPNRGQADRRVKFISRGQGYTLYLTATEAVLKLRRGARVENAAAPTPNGSRELSTGGEAQTAVLRMRMVGAKAAPRVEGREGREGKVNYLAGNDRARWHTDIPTFGEVRYTGANNLPTRNAFQPSRQSTGDGLDAFVAVFNPAAERGNNTLLYSSFLGGDWDGQP